MSSTHVSMPSVSATRRPSRRLSGSESLSGISTPSTLLGPSARDAQRRRDAGIDAAGQAEHDAAPAQAAQHLLAHRRGDARSLGGGVESQRSRPRSRPARSASLDRASCSCAQPPVAASAIWRRLILPVSVFGSAARNSTDFGTMKSSRCARAVADHVVARSSVASGSSATTALIAMPRIGSGTPTTAASRTPGSA